MAFKERVRMRRRLADVDLAAIADIDLDAIKRRAAAFDLNKAVAADRELAAVDDRVAREDQGHCRECRPVSSTWIVP